ncbi:MAG: phosphate ABC transporter substrate-binding protein PstS family protein [Actinomycetota bacterium]|nr:phosphate ABC transporter substrate-binding protein PstS family protein [Actinomycetota bacterium]
MIVRGKTLRLLTAALGAALVVGACAPEDDASGSTEGGDLSGEINISGSSTVEPITSLVAEEFSGINGGVDISVDGPGTSDGFELFCKGDIDIADASRALEEEEIQACEDAGIEFIELKIAIDGLSVVTNADNEEIECLDFYDLYALLGPESEGFENWSDANQLGEEIGAAHTPYPDAPLDVTAPGEESGTYDSFGEIVLEGIAYDERDILDDAPVIRPDYQSSGDDNVIIQGIQGSDSSLGWVGFAFYTNNEDTVRALPLAEKGDDCVEPTVETIQDGSYPISRPLFFYVNAESAEDPAIEAFVDYYLSDEGLAAVSATGYVEQTDEVIETARSLWADRTTGSQEEV